MNLETNTMNHHQYKAHISANYLFSRGVNTCCWLGSLPKPKLLLIVIAIVIILYEFLTSHALIRSVGDCQSKKTWRSLHRRHPKEPQKNKDSIIWCCVSKLRRLFPLLLIFFLSILKLIIFRIKLNRTRTPEFWT